MDLSRLHEEMTRNLREFEVTETHLKLLRLANVCWSEVEFGAPEINGKRPYGNSNVLADVAEVIRPDIAVGDPDLIYDYAEEHEDELARLHVETAIVLQIALCTGVFRPGRYRKVGWNQWDLVAPAVQAEAQTGGEAK
jgi:hypothetical protein